MASITKRNNSYSVIYYFKTQDGIRKQKWETYKTLEDAQKRKEYLENHTINQFIGNLVTFEDLTVDILCS